MLGYTEATFESLTYPYFSISICFRNFDIITHWLYFYINNVFNM